VTLDQFSHHTGFGIPQLLGEIGIEDTGLVLDRREKIARSRKALQSAELRRILMADLPK